MPHHRRPDFGSAVDVSALAQATTSVSLLVSSDTVVSDVLAQILDKYKMSKVTVDDLVIVEEEVRGPGMKGGAGRRGAALSWDERAAVCDEAE